MNTITPPTYHPDVIVFLVEPEGSMRRNIRTALGAYGFETVSAFESIETLMSALEKESPDLIICDSTMPDGDMNDLVRQLRHWEAGSNPFIPVITMTWDSSEASVKEVIASGTDFLVGKPLSAEALFKRIKALVNNRKPFVVTRDYIGPDHGGILGATSDLRKFEVPNTLKSKVNGEEVTIDIDVEVRAMWREMIDERIGLSAFHTAFLVNLILHDLKDGFSAQSVRDNTHALMETCREARQRLKGGKHEQTSELFKQLFVAAHHVHHHPYEQTSKQVKLMKPLSMALNRAASPDQNEEVIARNINAAVAKFQDRQKAQSVRKPEKNARKSAVDSTPRIPS